MRVVLLSWIATLVLALAVVLFSGSSAPADWEGDREALDRRVVELTKWIIEKRPDLKAGDPPIIVFASHDSINRAVESEDGLTYAFYQPPYGIIWLPETFELGKHDHYLVHELYHHLQFENEVKFACGAEYEPDAYRIMWEFAKETGIGHVPTEEQQKKRLILFQCGVDH